MILDVHVFKLWHLKVKKVRFNVTDSMLLSKLLVLASSFGTWKEPRTITGSDVEPTLYQHKADEFWSCYGLNWNCNRMDGGLYKYSVLGCKVQSKKCFLFQKAKSWIKYSDALSTFRVYLIWRNSSLESHKRLV